LFPPGLGVQSCCSPALVSVTGPASIQEARPSLEPSTIPEGVGSASEADANSLQPSIRRLLPLLHAPRCGARTRAGTPCQSLAVDGKARCRMHGGAKGSGAPKGRENGNDRHGLFTCEAIETRRETHAMIAEFQAFAQDILQR
jgi:hypothetical protein